MNITYVTCAYYHNYSAFCDDAKSYIKKVKE